MIHWTELEVVYKDGMPISGEVVFSHVDDKTNEVRHFAVERLERYLATATTLPPIIEIEIDPIFAMFAVKHRGAEQHRLLAAMQNPANIAHYPIMLAHMPGVGRDHAKTEHLIIDGIHRYIAAAALGWKTIRGYDMPPSLWEQYLIDIPDLEDITRDKLARQAQGVPIDSHLDAQGRPIPFNR